MKFTRDNLRHRDNDPEFYVFDDVTKIVLAEITPNSVFDTKEVFRVNYHSDMSKYSEQVIGKAAAIEVASRAVVEWVNQDHTTKSDRFKQAYKLLELGGESDAL